MSQAKVDRYKEEKRNRKETMAKEKRKHTLSVLAGSVVAIALVCWIGVSGYNMYQSNKPLETIYVDMTELDNYMNSLEAE